MGSEGRGELVRLIYRCPVEIACKMGYEKLTDLHNRWIAEMVFGESDRTLQSHRGSFKTTCLIVAIAFIMVLLPGKRVLFMRKTDADVVEVLTAVAGALQSPYLQAIARGLYGTGLKLEKNTNAAINTNLALGVSGAPQLVGLGCGGSLTGKHADLIFTDDIVNLKDRVSRAERTRTKLIYQELQNIRNAGGRIFNTGTPWHKDDAFALMPNIVRHDCYSTGLLNRREIEAKRASMTPSLFAANYELKHIADEDALFKAPKFFHDPALLRDGKGHIDAAYGGGDGTAFSVAKRANGVWYVFGRRWEKHVDDCLGEIIALCRALRVGTVFVEKNADKGSTAKSVRKLGQPAASYNESQNKFIKISTHLRGAWKDVLFLDCDAFPLDCEYLNEILDYTERAEHDDSPDSLASLMRQYGRAPSANFDTRGV